MPVRSVRTEAKSEERGLESYLTEDPEKSCRDSQRGLPDERRGWEVERKKDEVPQEVLLRSVWTQALPIASDCTWLVQTLLKVTKAKVWASIAVARLFLARTSGRATTTRKS